MNDDGAAAELGLGPVSPVAELDLSDPELGALVADALADEDLKVVPCPHEDTGTGLSVLLSSCTYYTRRDGGEHVDASGMFETPCYNRWLQTRSSELVRPEEAFRKAITSHCSKTDGRKAFPPPVEAAVLREVRKKRVWPCFEGLLAGNGWPVTIGRNGFRGQGSHEQDAIIAAEPAPADSASASPRSGLVDLPSAGTAKRAAPPTEASDFVEPDANNMRERVRTNLAAWAYNLPLLMTALQTLGVRPSEFGLSQGSEDDFTEEAVRRTLHPGVVPWTFRAVCMAALTRYFHPRHFQSLAFAQLFDEDELSLPLAADDTRLSYDFMFWEGMALLPGIPTGRGVVCMNTFSFLEADKDMCAIMGGNMFGRPTQEHAHPAIHSTVLANAYPRYMESGTIVFCQYWAKTMSGGHIVLRMRFNTTESGNDKAERVAVVLQDVSHLYPELFTLPPLKEVVQRLAHQEVSDSQRLRSVEIGAATMRIINGD